MKHNEMINEETEQSGQDFKEEIDYPEILILMREIGVAMKQLCDMPPGELVLLLTLSRVTEPNEEIRPSKLGRLMKTSRPAVSRLLKSLKKKGYLQLTCNTADHRYTKVALTPGGREQLESSVDQCSGVLRKVADRMGHDKIRVLHQYNQMFLEYLSEELREI